MQRNWLADFRYGILLRLVIVKPGIHYRHHFVAGTGQIVFFAAAEHTTRAGLKADVRGLCTVGIGGNEIVCGRPAVKGFHGIAGVRGVEAVQRELPRYLPFSALIFGSGDRVKGGPGFVILVFGAGLMVRLDRQHRALIQVTGLDHPLHMAPHVGSVNIRAGNHRENDAERLRHLSTFVVWHDDTNRRFHAQPLIVCQRQVYLAVSVGRADIVLRRRGAHPFAGRGDRQIIPFRVILPFTIGCRVDKELHIAIRQRFLGITVHHIHR